MFWAIGSILVLAGVLAFERAWVRYKSTPVADRWRARRRAIKDRRTPEELEMHFDELRRKHSAEMKEHEHEKL